MIARTAAHAGRTAAPLPRRPPHPLSSAHPGSRYRITRVLFELVRDRCHEKGLHEGDEVICLERRKRTVTVERTDRQRVQLEWEYAWFIQVRETTEPAP
jgi:hypothetical protein